mmetsp:Transcript_62097/g.108687  ORF Transcript_62097/g.108687 Transcript_62097/m.108687 type:complete len:283 (-) Transcript_62097:39-887(-)
MLANAMWRTQVALHGKNNSVALPSLLVTAASAMVVYRHFTDEQGGDPTKHFLALIVIQMLPLVFLEMKILSCPDPVAMLSRFGTKVLLMHAFFLVLRVAAWPLLEVGLGFCNLVGLLAACVALHFGFRFRCANMHAHLDVVGLTLLAVFAALLTELLDFHRPASLLECTIFTASSYVEILAFVPAVWMVHQTVKKGDDCFVSGSSRVQTQAAFFFAFLVPFYVMEDLISAFRVGSGEPFAAIGHIVHFLLLLDFACFLMSHIYNPNQLQGSFLRWLPDQLFV